MHSVRVDSAAAGRLTVRFATDLDRSDLYRLRHLVYAQELHQHACNAQRQLTDSLDTFNVYLVATCNSSIIGFVSITPPGHEYSIDKYLDRDELPFTVDDTLHEIRLLTLHPAYRQTATGSRVLAMLMYGALRFVETHGGQRVVAIGRQQVVNLYKRVGMRPLGRTITSGEVIYELLAATTAELRQHAQDHRETIDALSGRIDWKIDFPLHPPAGCFHGGAFFDAIGDEFDRLGKRHEIVNADVLDAWFPPAPAVIEAVQDTLPWLMSTSPPTNASGMTRIIAKHRGIPFESVLVGAGSSDLIYLAFHSWLSRDSRVLMLDPTYGEYGHVCENVIKCHTDRFALDRSSDFQVDLEKLASVVRAGRYDMLIVVNPNNPAGAHIPRAQLEEFLGRLPENTRVWIDEAYIDYLGADQSLEKFAVRSPNVIVCKSMSKVYALSGIRAAYLCSMPGALAELRGHAAPWSVSLPAQLAAVRALEATQYYHQRYAETHLLRQKLVELVRDIDNDIHIYPGVANWILCRLPENGPDAAHVIERCRQKGVFLRGATGTGRVLDRFDIRLAVKDGKTQEKMVSALAQSLAGPRTITHPESSTIKSGSDG
jgi:histidinol-phosphate/aromatic aminotransferase/cobyric acid decarboxylase-like protein